MEAKRLFCIFFPLDVRITHYSIGAMLGTGTLIQGHFAMSLLSFPGWERLR